MGRGQKYTEEFRLQASNSDKLHLHFKSNLL